MNIKSFLTAAVLTFVVSSGYGAPLEYYLPEGSSLDARIPKPSATLGEEVGEWHVRHDQLIAYLRVLAESSDRVTIQETGRTYENRPVTLVTISSPANIRNIDTIREGHAAITRAGSPPPGDALQSVIWLCYSVHGNESSGANASMITAYYLAASKDPEILSLLEECVILIDPSLNPDGLDRFATWTNSHRGINPVTDSKTREHNEVWPGGRTNHYWFDLNRDWLLLTHPESRARVHTFHQWKPDIVCDFHEMGTDATYFFQPGVPSRTNPLTPEANQDLTRRIAAYHASRLDEAGRLYYSGERFDDFYYGKGSTYPDVNGSIGILFEQASSRGRRQDSINGVVEFPFTIKNQFLTSLSSMQACRELRRDLLQYKYTFFQNSRLMASQADGEGFLFGDALDPVRTDAMAKLLSAHDIDVLTLSRDISLNGRQFKAGRAYVVPFSQDQYRLINALFEKKTSFTDSLFYDVSTWTLPLAMNMPYGIIQRTGNLLGKAFRITEAADSPSVPTAHAYAIPWEGYLAPKAANELLEAGLQVRVATKPMTTSKGELLTRGTLLIPSTGQSLSSPAVNTLVAQVAARNHLPVITLATGLTPSGPDLGSPSTPSIKKVSAAIAVGSGVSSYWAGEVWHLLDYRMGMEVSHLEKKDISAGALDRYTHLILPHGSYGSLGEGQVEDLKEWINNGGILMAMGSAVSWVGDNEITPLSFVTAEDESEGAPEKLPYSKAEADRGSKLTSGAIFRTAIDTTHPLGFGYSGPTVPVFRTHNRILDRSQNPYATVTTYTESPLESGYISAENLERLPGSASLIAQRSGKGAVILYNDNPNFRGVWYGTNKLFLNGLFFGSLIRNTDE